MEEAGWSELRSAGQTRRLEIRALGLRQKGAAFFACGALGFVSEAPTNDVPPHTMRVTCSLHQSLLSTLLRYLIDSGLWCFSNSPRAGALAKLTHNETTDQHILTAGVAGSLPFQTLLVILLTQRHRLGCPCRPGCMVSS